MNKLTTFSAIFFSALLISCSTPQKQEQQLSSIEVASTNKTSAPKHVHRHRKLPNGTLSLDIVNYDNKLHLLTGTHQNGEKALWYQYSSNQGIDWSTPVNINSTTHIDANLSPGNPARLAVQRNNIVVIWASRVEGAPHNAGPMQAVRSSDNGKSWQKSPIPADWTAGSHAFFAMDGNDVRISAVWLDSRNGHSSVNGSQGMRYSQSTDGGQSWSTNQTLDNITCACCWNTAKFDAKNNLYVLYRDNEPTDMALGMVNPDQQWQRLSTVGAFDWDFPGCPHIGGGLAFQNNDQLVHSVVGSGHEKHLGVHYLRSNNHGKNWSQPIQLGDETAVHADVAAHKDGRVVAVWDMLTEDGLSIFYAKSKNNGKQWSSPVRLSKAGMRATHPRIISNNSGFLALWVESADGKHQQTAMKQL